MDNSFSSLIESASSVLVLLPTKPTFDTVAAGLSLYFSIKDRKEANISCPTPMMVGFNRIIGIDKITSELGNKNLTIKFKGYDAANIEKVSYDIINGEFNLTVVPKAGFTSPQKEQMDISFSGVSSDLVILIGGSNDSDFPILTSDELSSAKIVHIGNRVLSSDREIMSLAVSGATTSEIIAEMIKVNEMSLDPDIATNLVMGIEEGSSNFTSSDVTPDTFETFAFLLRSGGRRQPKVKLSPMGFPPGAIPTQPFGQKVSKVSQAESPEPVEAIENKETMIENPPDEWLQPKVYKGSNQPSNQPDPFSENKG